jgi:N-acetyl-anhydromuramoyl-L-alanine amidase
MTNPPHEPGERRSVVALWNEGWYRFAHRLPSPNFGLRPQGACIDLIVVHSISLPPGEYGGEGVQRLFTNQLDWNLHPYFKRIEGMQVSAHFYIRRNGELWQFVSADHRAWHAGASTYRGRDNCNDHSIGIELEGIEGGDFEAAQYETLGSVCPVIAQHYPVHLVAGHEHIAPGRKADPGAGFNWPLLQQSLGWPAQCFPDGVVSKCDR